MVEALREQVLTTEVVGYAVDRALELWRERQERGRLAERRERMAEVDRRLGNLVESLADVGPLPEITQRISDLRREPDRLQAELRAGESVIEVEQIRQAIQGQFRDLRGALSASPEHARLALQALFADRLRVFPVEERGYRVEGSPALPLPDTRNARPRLRRPGVC